MLDSEEKVRNYFVCAHVIILGSAKMGIVIPMNINCAVLLVNIHSCNAINPDRHSNSQTYSKTDRPTKNLFSEANWTMVVVVIV